MAEDGGLDRSKTLFWNRWPSVLDIVVTPMILAGFVGYVLIVPDGKWSMVVRESVIPVMLVVSLLIGMRLKQNADEADEDWEEAWGRVLIIHLASSVAAFGAIETVVTGV